ncbi:MAG TPA: tetratricopeptide repeat protein [Candidatus Paceibacterota bacterium]|nr:tetratricopeptide repeat protein [Candidatus Paceibacterota bacterium]
MSEFAAVPAPPPRRAHVFRKVGRWLLFVLAFITPFFFLPITDDPVGINKFAAIAVLTAVAFICFLGCVLEERQFDYPKSLLAAVFGLFVIAEAISAWVSIAPDQSFWGGLSAPDSFASIIVYAFVFFLFFYFFREQDLAMVMTAAGAGFAVAVALMTFTDPLGGATAWGILAGSVVVALAAMKSGTLSKRHALYFFAATIAALGVLALVNDAPLWLVLAGFVMLVAALRFGPRAHFQYAFAVILVALFFALVSPHISGLTHRKDTPRPDFAASISAAKGTLLGGSVAFGTGPATYNLDFAAFKPTSVNMTDAWSASFGQGHDFAVTLLATGGIAAILLFLWLVILVVLPLFSIEHMDTTRAVGVSVSAFLAVSLFFYPGFFSGFIVLFILLGLLAAARSRGTFRFADWAGWRSVGMSLVMVACAAIVFAGTFFLGEKYAAAAIFRQAQAALAKNDSAAAFDKVKRAINLDPQDAYYRTASNILVNEAKLLATQNMPTASAEVPIVVANALQAAANAARQNPRDPANWGNLGAVYEAVMPVLSGADVSALQSYLHAASLDPVNPSWDVAIARTYIEAAGLLPASSTDQQKADWNTAESFLQKAIDLKDDYADPRVMLVGLYLNQGNIGEAIQKVQELKEQNPLDPGVAFELGYLYYQNGNLDAAQEEFQVAAILEPNYANAYYYLGVVHAAKGELDQARAQFELALRFSPGNQDIEQAIQNLQASGTAPETAATSTATSSASRGSAKPPVRK